METRDIFKATCVNNGKFTRVDIPIRVMGVMSYHRTGKVCPLWWRMQYAKLWYRWGLKGRGTINVEPDQQDAINNQKGRLFQLCRAFSGGKALDVEPMVVGKGGVLIDGSHRLSCFIYFGIKYIPKLATRMIDCEPVEGYVPEEESGFIKELYSKDEWEQIINYRDMLINKWRLFDES